MYLSSRTDPTDVIIRFVALACIAKVDDFYAAALPNENKIKRKCKPLQVQLNKRDWQNGGKDVDDRLKEEMLKTGLVRNIHRYIFKIFRLIYCSYIFYFMPYTIIWMPYLSACSNAA